MYDTVKIVLSFIFLTAGFVSYYISSNLLGIPRLVACAVGFLGFIVLFLWAKNGRLLLNFSRESYDELAKVVWPTRKETWQLTTAVFVFVLIVAIYLAIVDGILRWLLYSLFLGWNG